MGSQPLAEVADVLPPQRSLRAGRQWEAAFGEYILKYSFQTGEYVYTSLSTSELDEYEYTCSGTRLYCWAHQDAQSMVAFIDKSKIVGVKYKLLT